jgi:hypothetical protein
VVVKSGLRCFPFILFAVLVLGLSPSALADAMPYLLAVPAGSPGCPGFSIETTDGTPTGCTPWTGLALPDINFLNMNYSAAADGSVVFVNDDANHGGEGSIWLVHPNGSAVHLDDSTWDFEGRDVGR